MKAHVRHAAVAYLLFEATSLVVYWILLTFRPAWRAPFTPPGGDERALFAFAAGDLVLYAASGVAGAIGIVRMSPWRGAVLWLHAGAAMYAAMFAVSLWPMAPDRWLGAVMMLPALAAPAAIAWLCSRQPGGR